MMDVQISVMLQYGTVIDMPLRFFVSQLLHLNPLDTRNNSKKNDDDQVDLHFNLPSSANSANVLEVTVSQSGLRAVRATHPETDDHLSQPIKGSVEGYRNTKKHEDHL